jgi:hypothetical protein
VIFVWLSPYSSILRYFHLFLIILIHSSWFSLNLRDTNLSFVIFIYPSWFSSVLRDLHKFFVIFINKIKTGNDYYFPRPFTFTIVTQSTSKHSFIEKCVDIWRRYLKYYSKWQHFGLRKEKESLGAADVKYPRFSLRRKFILLSFESCRLVVSQSVGQPASLASRYQYFIGTCGI